MFPTQHYFPQPTIKRATRNGIRYQLDISDYMDHVVYYHANTEPRSVLYGMVKVGDTVLDIGANLGETSLNFAKLVGSSGSIFSFEPVNDTFSKLEKNLSLNKTLSTRIKAYKIALSDKADTLFYGNSFNRNTSAIGMGKSREDGSINSTESITLDEFVDKEHIKQINMIKIDVEGFEMFVLRGGIETIRKYKPSMFIELDNHNLTNLGFSALAVKEWLAELGYSLFDLHMNLIKGTELLDPSLHIDVLAIPNTTQKKLSL